MADLKAPSKPSKSYYTDGLLAVKFTSSKPRARNMFPSVTTATTGLPRVHPQAFLDPTTVRKQEKSKPNPTLDCQVFTLLAGQVRTVQVKTVSIPSLTFSQVFSPHILCHSFN